MGYPSWAVPIVRSGESAIHYLDTGRGVPVVLVHSGGLSSRQWFRWTPRLETTHRVVALDLLGAGASDPVPPAAPFHFSQDVAALDAVLDALATPYHLVGHSYGGLIALTSARLRPARVLSLSLFEPVAFGVLYSTGDAAGVHNLESYDHDGTFLDDAAGGSEPWMERFVDWWQGAGAWQGLPAPSRAAFLKVGRKVFQEVRSLTADRTPHGAYAALAAPTLLMTAKRSPLAAQRVCAVLARTLPRAELATYDDAGHMAPITHAQTICERVAAHVRAHDPAPTA
jgi:pimeloyl-ACP methyl ester carboxylesterase